MTVTVTPLMAKVCTKEVYASQAFYSLSSAYDVILYSDVMPRDISCISC